MAVNVAAHFSTEVVSADSRQLYQELNIGTAKPLPEEMQGIPHHFIDTHSVNEEFSAGDFADKAALIIDRLFSENQVVVISGGSGLYIDALLYGVDDLPSKDQNVRNELNRIYRTEGIQALREELEKVDPETCSEIDIHNPQRIIRAIEVFRTTGRKASELRGQAERKARWPFMMFGIRHERDKLYDRINERVDRMFREGLEEEVRKNTFNRHQNALQTVGYKEVFRFLDGELSREECIELVKKNTRNYAKRQLTWFRRYPEMHWVDPGDHPAIIRATEERLTVRN